MQQEVDQAEAEVAALLEAIAEAHERAALAYEFSSGCAYAYSALLASQKAARLAGVPTKKR